MDIIESFYQHVRVKQMLHFFIKAQAKKFEFIPFIEDKTLVHSFHANIYESKNTLKHILDDIGLPYKKRKFNNKCNTNIDNVQKYNVYLFTRRNKAKPNTIEDIRNIISPSISTVSKSSGDDSLKISDISQQNENLLKPVSIEDLIAYDGYEPNLKGRRQYIEDLLNSIIIRDFHAEVDSDKDQRDEKPILDKNLFNLLYNINSVVSVVTVDKKTKAKRLKEFLIETITQAHLDYQNINLSAEKFKEQCIQEFLKYKYPADLGEYDV